MKHLNHFKKLIIAALLVTGVQVALASSVLTGVTDDKIKNNNYSLKNLSSLSYKNNLSIHNLNSGLQFRSTQLYTDRAANGVLEMNSSMRFDKGNITYVFPYKLKVKVPKFRTPSPTN
ncbi:hypothetical protein ACI6Q2_00215 [Chitinophagaceae bacterium LWZ2-11]